MIIFNYLFTSLHNSLTRLVLFSLLISAPVLANTTDHKNVNAKSYKVAILYPREAPFWQTFINLMQAAADDLNIELVTFCAKGNRFLMKQQLLSVIQGSNKVDAVVFNNYKDSGSQFIKLANEAEVFSFLVNSAMPEAKAQEMGAPRELYPFWLGQMHPDERGANKRIIERLISDAKSHKPDSLINVVGVNGPISSGAAIMRSNALTNTLKNIENVKLKQIVNAESWDEDEANLKFQALMKRYRDIHVVWAGSARLVDGILEGEKSLGVKAGQDYFTGGVGFKKSMLEAIEANRVSASAGGHYIEGVWVLVLLHDYFKGIDFVDHGVQTKTNMGIVTKENVNLYLEILSDDRWSEENLSKIDFKQYSKFYNPSLDKYKFDFDSILLQLY